MSLESFKITDGNIAEKGVVAAPDKLTGTAQQNKMVFDRLIREAVKGLFNGLIDALTDGGAANTGVDPISGLSGDTVQEVLESLKAYADAGLALKEPLSASALLIKSVSFDANTGVFTFTRENGSTVAIDTLLEKVVTNWQYDQATQSLVLTAKDGTVQRISLSAFITETEFLDSDTIDFSVSNHVVTAAVKAGSITESMLSSALVTMLQGYVSSAAGSASAAGSSATAAQTAKTAAETAKTAAETANASAQAAKTAAETAEGHAETAEAAAGVSAMEAKDSAEDAEAWAVGKRDGVDVPSTDPAYHNNAKYWNDQAHGAAAADMEKAVYDPAGKQKQVAFDDEVLKVSQKGAAGGVATLGSDGKVPSGQLPPISAGVESFNGRTGAVTLTRNDVNGPFLVEGRLPTGYTELEWLEASGGKHVDTGYKHKTETRYQFKSAPITTASGKYCGIISARSAYNNADEISFYYTSAYLNFNIAASSNNHTISNAVVGSPNIVAYQMDTANGITITVDGQTFTNSKKSVTTSQNNDWLFCGNTAGSASDTDGVRIYWLKIFEGDTLLHEFVPCRNPSGAAGMYDTIGNTFCPLTGSAGSYTEGPVVEDQSCSGVATLDGGGKVPERMLPAHWYHRTFSASDWTVNDSDTDEYKASITVPRSAHNLYPAFGCVTWRARSNVSGSYIPNTWAALETIVSYNFSTGAIVIKATSAYAGDILISG